MKTVLLQLAEDFLSALAFALVFALTGNLVVATSVAIAVALAQMIVTLARKKKATPMRWIALALAVSLGCLTLLTHDTTFIRIKPSIVHCAIGAAMLKRGWQWSYMPERVRTRVPEREIIAWGYAWAALMFAMGFANLAGAYFLSVGVWGVLLTCLALGKLAFFALQYLALRRSAQRGAATAT
jgi:intracellular septation protein